MLDGSQNAWLIWQENRDRMTRVNPLEASQQKPRDLSECIAKNFARDRTSIIGSLKFIANKHGESLFDYEDANDFRDKISRTLRYSHSLSNLYQLLQRDLLAQSFALTWFNQGFAMQPERLIASGHERLKSGCQLSLSEKLHQVRNTV